MSRASRRPRWRRRTRERGPFCAGAEQTVLVEQQDESARSLLAALSEALSPERDAAFGESTTAALRERISIFAKEKKIIREWCATDPADGAIVVAPFGVTVDEADAGATDAEKPTEAVTEDDDAGSFRREALPLDAHLRQVEAKARCFSKGTGLPRRLAETLAFAAAWHDAGKADPRFQKYLAGGVEPGPEPLAKSGEAKARGATDRRVRAASGLPDCWRHEVLSVRLAARDLARREAWGDIDAELALFLIGAHHGQGRPFFRHEYPWDSWERRSPRRMISTARI